MIDMNKEDIINVLKRYNFDKNKYMVISGAAMVLLGIKESTNDIDISIKEDYYDLLLKDFNCTFERINEHNKKVYYIDKIINFSASYYSKKHLLLNDIPVQIPKEILELKLYLNREKDKKDIELIKEFMNE